MGTRLLLAAEPTAGHLLEAAQRALQAGAFDAARANAALAVISVVRVLAGRPLGAGVGVGEPSEMDAMVDALEGRGRITRGLARDFRSVLDDYRSDLFLRTGFEDANRAVTVARRAAALLGRDADRG